MESTDCDGTTSTVISNEYCHIDFSTLVASLNFNGGESVWAKVVAVNIYGETELSPEGNGAVYTRVADAPLTLSEDISVRTSTTDGLTWIEAPHNGGLSVIDYRIYQRVEGTETYTEIATGITSTSYTVTSLVLGTTYEFTVEARND